MRDQILAKLFSKKLAKGPNRWTPTGEDFLEDFASYNFSMESPTFYAEKLAEQVRQLFGPSARIVVDNDPAIAARPTIYRMAAEPEEIKVGDLTFITGLTAEQLERAKAQHGTEEPKE